jgi:hypothetical protein
MLEHSLIYFYLTQLLLQLLISSFYLSYCLAQVLIDLDHLLIISVSRTSVVNSSHQGFMHYFVFINLSLKESNLFLHKLPFLFPS